MFLLPPEVEFDPEVVLPFESPSELPPPQAATERVMQSASAPTSNFLNFDIFLLLIFFAFNGFFFPAECGEKRGIPRFYLSRNRNFKQHFGSAESPYCFPYCLLTAFSSENRYRRGGYNEKPQADGNIADSRVARAFVRSLAAASAVAAVRRVAGRGLSTVRMLFGS